MIYSILKGKKEFRKTRCYKSMTRLLARLKHVSVYATNEVLLLIRELKEEKDCRDKKKEKRKRKMRKKIEQKDKKDN